MSVTPFRIEIPEADLADLRQRLERARWPEPETVTDWSQGVPLAYQQELCRYWVDGYDWRATEARLNALPQFRTEIDGLSIHFLHVRSPHAEALPLILTHGWPGSIVEFLKVIAPLSDPTAHGGDAADAFHVVCPSLPGYGFSGRPAQPGWNVQRIAAAWMTLMARLGYQRYGAAGGDWGTSITTSIGQQDPGHLAGDSPDPADRSARSGHVRRSDRGGAGFAGRARARQGPGVRILRRAGDQAPDGGVRAGGLARRPGRLDRREILVLDRLRRPPRDRADPRRASRQRDVVLATGHRSFVRATVLGKLQPGLGVVHHVDRGHRRRARGLLDLS